MEKFTKNRTQTTQRILNALEDEINEYGWRGVALNRISQRAKVSKTLIYRYFGNLDGLMAHYMQLDKFFPVFTSQILDHMRPQQMSDLASIWSRQVIQIYRSLRSTKSARELLKATLFEPDPTADVISQVVDKELTRLVNQLTFVQGADTQAISAVMLAGMSYLTIMAQTNRPVIGLDLRSAEDWKRIEEAVKLMYVALNELAMASNDVTLESRLLTPIVDLWP